MWWVAAMDPSPYELPSERSETVKFFDHTCIDSLEAQPWVGTG